MPAETHWDVRLAGVLLEYSRHVCGFSRTPEEAHDLFLPFMKDGLDKCERGFSIVDSEQRDNQVSASSNSVSTPSRPSKRARSKSAVGTRRTSGLVFRSPGPAAPAR